MHQIYFWPGLCPGPARVARDVSPEPLVGWGSDTLPIPHPFDA